jgi:hypothetical protein
VNVGVAATKPWGETTVRLGATVSISKPPSVVVVLVARSETTSRRR